MNEIKPSVIFVHVTIPIGKMEDIVNSIRNSGCAIKDAFEHAPSESFFKLDEQSVFVDNDIGFPYLVKLLEDVKKSGLHFAILEVGPTGVTLLEDHPALSKWLSGKLLPVRFVKAPMPSAPNKS